MNKKLCVAIFVLNVILVGLFIWADSALSTSAYYPSDSAMYVISVVLSIAIIRAEVRYINTH